MYNINFCLITMDERRRLYFKKLVSNLRTLTTTDEFGAGKLAIPIGYLLEYTQNDIIDWLSLVVAPEKRSRILLKAWNEVEWCRAVALELFELRCHDLVYWFWIYAPHFKRNIEPLTEWRSHYVEMLEVLYDIWPKYNFFTEQEFMFMTGFSGATYALAYQNFSNRNILRKVCRLVRKIFPVINYVNPWKTRMTAQSKMNRIRVCFVGELLTADSSVLRDRMGVILGLDREKFDVYYASTNSPNDIKAQAPLELLKSNGGVAKYIQLDPASLTISRSRLENFDIIVYPEIGMRVITTMLAYSRLAPIQLTTWGHSDTSGIDTIDYYITSKYFEVSEEIQQRNYSERVIALNSLSTYYYDPSKFMFIGGTEESLKSRSELGFANDAVIYMCLQSSFKITEILEDCIASIARENPKARILLSINIPFPKSVLARFIAKIGDTAETQLIFYPTISKRTFINLVKICDVMLDPYPFGGCNSSLEAFSFGVPVITWPTEFINGRFTSGFYNYMGLGVGTEIGSQCIVSSKEEYIKQAILLGNDVELRHSINAEILKRKHVLFEDTASIIEWNETLLNLFNGGGDGGVVGNK